MATRNGLIITCIVLLVVLLGLVCVMLGLEAGEGLRKPNSSSSSAAGVTVPVKKLQILSVEEQTDYMIVTTTYCAVKFPYAFSDIIGVKAETCGNYAKMDFTATVGENEVMLYTLFFNKATGIPVGTLMVDGTTYTVTAEIYDMDQINDEYRLTFQAAQETINDVIVSLGENSGFVAAQ
jgi:hypothetical protein